MLFTRFYTWLKWLLVIESILRKIYYDLENEQENEHSLISKTSGLGVTNWNF
jgi:hypothetical protein